MSREGDVDKLINMRVHAASSLSTEKGEALFVDMHFSAFGFTDSLQLVDW